MLAFQLVSAHTTELREVAVPVAVCPRPVTLGHENAGWVKATGITALGAPRV